jgi:hypothetical protein
MFPFINNKTGYGDIVPISDEERLFNCIAIILTCIVFGYILNKIGEVFTNIDDSNMLFK